MFRGSTNQRWGINRSSNNAPRSLWVSMQALKTKCCTILCGGEPVHPKDNCKVIIPVGIKRMDQGRVKTPYSNNFSINPPVVSVWIIFRLSYERLATICGRSPLEIWKYPIQTKHATRVMLTPAYHEILAMEASSTASRNTMYPEFPSPILSVPQ